MILVNCGKDESARDRNEGEIQTAQEEAAAEESKENANEVLDDEEIMEESLDAVESEEDLKTSTDYNSDLSAARSSEKGSMDTLSGRYYFSKDGQVLEGMEYVFMDDVYTITETGSYSISPEGITIKRGPNPETVYKVEATDIGYNLTNC